MDLYFSFLLSSHSPPSLYPLIILPGVPAMAPHIPPSIITIPPEICQLVLKSLSSRDITTLRLVSRDYYDYFTSEDLCHFAQKLYFPLSSEAGKPQRSRKDFDATYLRSQRWKKGRPSHVEIIDKVAFGSTSLSNGFLVDSEAGLLAYQRYSDLSPHPLARARASSDIFFQELAVSLFLRAWAASTMIPLVQISLSI